MEKPDNNSAQTAEVHSIPLRLLFLEDSALDAELALGRLEEGGFDCIVHRVETRETFESSLQDGDFDLIIADYSLPSFDGRSALELAHTQHPEIPFIFLSGAMGEERAIETLKNGATDYVLKNGMERLVPSVQRALREVEDRAERKRAVDALSFVAEASAVLVSSLDLETIFRKLTQLSVPRLADICTTDIIDGEGYIKQVAAVHANPDLQDALEKTHERNPFDLNGSSDMAQRLRGGEPILVPQVGGDWLSEPADHSPEMATQHRLSTALDVRSLMILPLQVRGRLVGAMSFARTSQSTPYTSEDLLLAQEMTQRASLATDNARLYREAQDAVRARDEFLAVVSHELRTPLNAMMGWTNLLRSGGLDADTVTRALETIERNTHAQAQLVEDLLDVSRIVAGKLILDTERVNLAAITTLAIDSLSPAAAAKSIELEPSYVDDTTEVMGDAGRLQQVIWNLLSNAIKFTTRGGKVKISIVRVQSFANIIVTDNGQGIGPEFLPHVFDRFSQADSSNTRSFGGLGLGLAIVRHLVELHGGTVEAQSDGWGKGATFTVRLPMPALRVTVAPGDTPEAAPEIAELGQGQLDAILDGLNILVVDDQQDARHLLQVVFERCGAAVTTAGSAPEALGILHRKDPDLMISDIGLPDSDGYELIKQVRASAESFSSIPALALTTFSRAEDKRRALESGFQKFVVKPVEPKELVKLVAELVGCYTPPPQEL
jgi:signal transduction histidine kinase/DNA-binding response OmpR family regulator